MRAVRRLQKVKDQKFLKYRIPNFFAQGILLNAQDLVSSNADMSLFRQLFPHAAISWVRASDPSS